MRTGISAYPKYYLLGALRLGCAWQIAAYSILSRKGTSHSGDALQTKGAKERCHILIILYGMENDIAFTSNMPRLQSWRVRTYIRHRVYETSHRFDRAT